MQLDKICLSVVVTFTLLSIAICLEVDQIRTLWHQHNARVKNFECSNPQPRNFNIDEIIDPEEKPSEGISATISSQMLDIISNKIREKSTAMKFYPSSTVLHRCASAGCCTNNQFCLPHRIDEVVLVFALREPGARELQFLEFNAVNHTHCSCQKNRILPK